MPASKTKPTTWETPVSGILGTRFPIILGPMRLITLGRMAAAVSNSGGLGVIAASGLSSDRLRSEIQTAMAMKQIKKVCSRTDRFILSASIELETICRWALTLRSLTALSRAAS